jgi:exodeoxyribonuclease VII large subunit
LVSATNACLKHNNQRLLNASQTLQAVSPLATLNRGYALVTEQASGQIIRSTKQLKVGDKVKTRLAKGYFFSKIDALIEE